MNQPTNTFMLTTIRPVTEIRYFSPSGVQPIARTSRRGSTCRTSSQAAARRASRSSFDPSTTRVTVVGYHPQIVTVDLDKVSSKSVPSSSSAARSRRTSRSGRRREPAAVDVTGPASVLERVVVGAGPP